MTLRGYYMEREQRIREEWFGRHETHFSEAEIGQRIVWKRPDSNTYRITFDLFSGRLIVFGDSGHAMYFFASAFGFEEIANLDFDYFAEKCVASEHGVPNEQWDPRVVGIYLDDFFNEEEKSLSDLFRMEGGPSTIYSREEWIRFLEHKGADIFGYDRLGELARCGLVPSYTCQGHYLGLQMAVKQLKEKGVQL